MGAARALVEARLTQMQAAENAPADARNGATRIARLHLARALLRAGVERFWGEQQGPWCAQRDDHIVDLARRGTP